MTEAGGKAPNHLRKILAALKLPPDLLFVLALVVAVAFSIVSPTLRGSPVRTVVGILFILWAPGYAIVSVLYPEKEDVHRDELRTQSYFRGSDSISGLERVTLSILSSVAIAILTGLGVDYSPFSITTDSVLAVIGTLTVAAIFVAGIRRRQLPIEARFTVRDNRFFSAIRVGLTSPISRTDLLLNVALIAGVLLVLVSAGYAVSVPSEDERFTEFYILSGNTEGESETSGYPTSLTVGDTEHIVIGIRNQEYQKQEYTVVILLQEVQTVEQTRETPTFVPPPYEVSEQQELNRFSVELASGETNERKTSIIPTMTGERLRLAFLLYHGNPPSDPQLSNADSQTHLWVTVGSPA